MIAVNVTEVKQGKVFHYAGRQYMRAAQDEETRHPAFVSREVAVLAYTAPDRNGNRVPVAFNRLADVFVDRAAEEKGE